MPLNIYSQTSTYTYTQLQLSQISGGVLPLTLDTVNGSFFPYSFTTPEGWFVTVDDDAGELEVTFSTGTGDGLIPGPGIDIAVDTLTVAMTDANSDPVTAIVRLRINPVFMTPVVPPSLANDGPLTFQETVATVIDLAANDLPGDNPIDWSTLQLDTNGDLPAGSILVSNGDGTITLTLPTGSVAAGPQFIFEYTVSDTAGNPAVSEASVDVTATPFFGYPYIIFDSTGNGIIDVDVPNAQTNGQIDLIASDGTVIISNIPADDTNGLGVVPPSDIGMGVYDPNPINALQIIEFRTDAAVLNGFAYVNDRVQQLRVRQSNGIVNFTLNDNTAGAYASLEVVWMRDGTSLDRIEFGAVLYPSLTNVFIDGGNQDVTTHITLPTPANAPNMTGWNLQRRNLGLKAPGEFNWQDPANASVIVFPNFTSTVTLNVFDNGLTDIKFDPTFSFATMGTFQYQGNVSISSSTVLQVLQGLDANGITNGVLNFGFGRATLVSGMTPAEEAAADAAAASLTAKGWLTASGQPIW